MFYKYKQFQDLKLQSKTFINRIGHVKSQLIWNKVDVWKKFGDNNINNIKWRSL